MNSEQYVTEQEVFRIPVPYGFVTALIKDLKCRVATAIYMTLCELVEATGANMVCVTQTELAKLLKVSVRTIKRTFSSLKKKGYIEILPDVEKTPQFKPRKIKVLLPTEVFQKILSATISLEPVESHDVKPVCEEQSISFINKESHHD